MNQETLFRTEKGIQLDGATLEQLDALHAELIEEHGLSHAQICEAASYSMAMVVRYALGLSADKGRVCALVSDSLSGWVCLATLRHLTNAGAEGFVLFVGQDDEGSADLERQLKPLTAQGVSISRWSDRSEDSNAQELLSSCHNALCGLFRPHQSQSTFEKGVVEILNDLSIPIHVVEAPPGVNVDLGTRAGEPLFGSSTLSLGAPLRGLAKGQDYIGRHYLCDISFSQSQYEKICPGMGALFAEQPVLQIFPASDEPK